VFHVFILIDAPLLVEYVNPRGFVYPSCRVILSGGGRTMVFIATFNNISVISWWSVLWVEEIGVHGENLRSVASNWQTLSHNVVSSTPSNERDSNSQL